MFMQPMHATISCMQPTVYACNALHLQLPAWNCFRIGTFIYFLCVQYL